MQLNQLWQNTQSDAWSEIGHMSISSIGNNELFWKVLLTCPEGKKTALLHGC